MTRRLALATRGLRSAAKVLLDWNWLSDRIIQHINEHVRHNIT